MTEGLRICGITHKMKNRIREHGDLWDILQDSGGMLLISPASHRGKKEPYMAWVFFGKDVNLVVENSISRKG